jgi:hypothetical protein
MSRLDREEYVEQAYLFRVLGERLPENMPLQELLEQVRDELLATTRLPMAIDFLSAELKHRGVIGPAMRKLQHYFTPFQAYLVTESESERGRFDFRMAVAVLRAEALYRADDGSGPGLFLFQFETLCRNRLNYDYGLAAIAQDPWFDANWREWILAVRRQVGLVDFAELVFVRSQHAWSRLRARNESPPANPPPILFGEQEGKIAYANRRKDPLYLFAALQRHLGYPPVPRPQPADETKQVLPQLLRRLERIETRVKLLEDDQKGGFDLSQFYQKPQ